MSATWATPVERITGVWRFERPARRNTQARSIPGHLLHLVIDGSYMLGLSGKEYDIKAGDVIYYYETEDVQWTGHDTPVAFYSVGFLAPQLAPPPVEHRVIPSSADVRDAFESLYRNSLAMDDPSRWLGCFSALFRILAGVMPVYLSVRQDIRAVAEPWWRVEQIIRHERIYRTTLEDVCSLVSCSRSSVVRSCRRVTGLSPMERLRSIRLDEARGLLRYSQLTISQIAGYLGYSRVQEFSREFKRFNGMTARDCRRGVSGAETPRSDER